MKILSQHNVKGIGSFIHVLYLTAPMLGMVSYAMSAVTMYTVLLPWTKAWFPWLTLPVFFGICIVAGACLLLCFYKFVYPSYMAFQNRQQYIHKNPIQEDLEKIKKALNIEN